MADALTSVAVDSDATTTPTDASDEPPLFAHIRANEIGAGLPIHTPFGARATVYADYTASGRSLSFIEEYVAAHVLPTYGNTHTTTSKTGRQSSDFVAEARTMVRNYLRCGKHDNILFLGSGATAGANRLVAMLGLAAPPAARAAARARPEAERPIVFVGPYEHHSNLLPWRDSIADVVQIGEAAHGGPDLAQLQAALEAAAARPLRVGAFSAASNVSGALTDVDAVTALLHSHNALAIWDYASAAPHAPVCMNPPAAAAAHASLLAKDAVFFSPHKFPGGPQAAGVLVFKSHLAELYCKGTADGRRASVAPGGGSVFFVSRDAHVYARAEEAREEAGTPPIIGAVRVALCMQLQQAVGWRAIAQADERLLHRMAAAWGSHPNLALLGHGARAGASAGAVAAGRLPIVSFAVRCGDLMLHHNYVVALLNDLFGIQARGGCMCAGPYSQALLGIDGPTSDAIQAVLEQTQEAHDEAGSANEALRPGYIRVSLPYFTDLPTLQYVLDAVAFVADDGWTLLPQYAFDASTGEWRHVRQRRPPRAWLGAVDYSSGAFRVADTPPPPPLQPPAERHAAALAEARALAAVARAEFKNNQGLGGDGVGGAAAAELLAPEAAALRWFLLPAEAAAKLRGTEPAARSPFAPCVARVPEGAGGDAAARQARRRRRRCGRGGRGGGRGGRGGGCAGRRLGGAAEEAGEQGAPRRAATRDAAAGRPCPARAVGREGLALAPPHPPRAPEALAVQMGARCVHGGPRRRRLRPVAADPVPRIARRALLLRRERHPRARRRLHGQGGEPRLDLLVLLADEAGRAVLDGAARGVHGLGDGATPGRLRRVVPDVRPPQRLPALDEGALYRRCAGPPRDPPARLRARGRGRRLRRGRRPPRRA